jgi:curved DNA-binding protein CbpA
MPGMASDPYAVLGITSRATDAELRAAYRRAVQREHPDHNGGSTESARRFEAVQEAYALIQVQRARLGAGAAQAKAARSAPTSDPDLEARLAAMERELADAREAREKARRAAREAEQAAAAAARGNRDRDRPSDEELGYYKTDDSFSQILSDAASEFLSDAREHHVTERVADLLDEFGSKLNGQPPKR